MGKLRGAAPQEPRANGTFRFARLRVCFLTSVFSGSTASTDSASILSTHALRLIPADPAAIEMARCSSGVVRTRNSPR